MTINNEKPSTPLTAAEEYDVAQALIKEARLRKQRRQRWIAASIIAILLVAGVAYGVGHDGQSGVPRVTATSIAKNSTLTTSWRAVGCPSLDEPLQQSLNGDVTGCFRVPALYTSRLVVALQAYVTKAQLSTAVTPSPPSARSDVTLTLRPRTATPGATVSVTGTYVGSPPAKRAGYVNLCWDGCRSGLQEQAVAVTWSSPTTFHTRLEVPGTAWFVASTSAVTVHPLQSGIYRVGIECLGSTPGCALGPAVAYSTIRLNAPASTRCQSAPHCETLHLSTSEASVGSVVKVTGWAPLQTIIGQPFGYNLSVTRPSPAQRYRPFTITTTPRSEQFSVVVASRMLRIAKSASWTSLGRVSYQSSLSAGLSALDAESTSHLVAWCQASRIVITGDPQPISVSTAGVSGALVGTNLTIFNSSTAHPECVSVLLDPRHRGTVYAGFVAEPGLYAPPLVTAGLYTTNAGATWHVVRPPAGMSFADFGGFRTEGHDVVALFAGSSNFSSAHVPAGTRGGLVPVEVTSNGGTSWSPTTLGCPSSGPCVTFGPYQWGNCAMNGSAQSLLRGLGPTASSGVKWTSPTWVSSVNSCSDQQLVATSRQDLLLVDSGSQYLLRRSTDAGRTWSYVALPLIPGMIAGPAGASVGRSLLLAPDGSLFTIVSAPSGQRQELFRLTPEATSWCHVPRVFGLTSSSGTVTALAANATSLFWDQTFYNLNENSNQSSRMHVVALSRLRC
jgi:hypothetical protein